LAPRRGCAGSSVQGIVTNLVIKRVSVGGHAGVYRDVARRDFGPMLAALALARLASVYAPSRWYW
jgi:hypothetical protein